MSDRYGVTAYNYRILQSADGSYNPDYPAGDKPSDVGRAVYDAILATANKFFDPEKVATGTGTQIDPWNSDQAQNDVVAGDVVHVLPGIFVGTDPGGNYNITPAFYPKVSGTNGNPITYIAENPAIYETTNLTEFRSGATVQASGWSAFGSLNQSDIQYFGIHSDNNGL